MTDSELQADKPAIQDGATHTTNGTAHDHGHGQSVAAWTGVGIIMLGSLVASIAVVLTSLWIFVVGAVICVAGVVAGKVLSAMGFGVAGRSGH